MDICDLIFMYASTPYKTMFLLFDLGKIKTDIKLATKLKQLLTISCKIGHKI